MTVIERATERLAEEERQYKLGAENSQDLAYWAAYLDGAKAQKKECDAAVAAVQNIKPFNPHGELREMLIDEMIDRMGEWEERYIEDANPMFRRRFYCSRCGDWTTHGKTRYCPNCGCRMDGETE